MRKFFVLLCTAVSLLTAVSCAKDAVTKITITDYRMHDGEIDLYVGDVTYLDIETTPAGKAALLSYSSSDDDVVTGTEGYIIAHGPGYATLTISSTNGKKATLDVNVYKRMVSKWTSGASSLEIAPGYTKSFQISVTSAPDMTEDNRSIFTAANLNYQLVGDNEGYFYYKVKDNTVTIGCSDSAPKDGSYNARLFVTGTGTDYSTTTNLTAVYRPVTGVSVSPTTVSELFEGASRKLNASVSPAGATVQDLIWEVTSGDSHVSLGPDGMSCNVTGNSAGTAVVTVSSKENPSKKASCTITVVQPYVKELKASVNQNVYFVGSNEKRIFAVSVTPDDFPYTIKSDNTSIAEVNGDEITFKSAGMATFTIKAGDKSIQKSILAVDKNFTMTPYLPLELKSDDAEYLKSGRWKVPSSKTLLAGINQTVCIGVNGYTATEIDWINICAGLGVSNAAHYFSGTVTGDFSINLSEYHYFSIKSTYTLSTNGTLTVKTTDGRTATINLSAGLNSITFSSSKFGTNMYKTITNGGTLTLSKSSMDGNGASIIVNGGSSYIDDYACSKPCSDGDYTFKCDTGNVLYKGNTVYAEWANAGTYKVYCEECPSLYFNLKITN